MCANNLFTQSNYQLKINALYIFGVWQGFKNLVMKSPGGTALYIRARVRDDQKIPTKSILAFQKGLFTLGRQIKKNIHI